MMPPSKFKSATDRGEIRILRKGGLVALPLSIRGFRLGQRVYFHAYSKWGAMLKIPRRCHKGRFLSTRVRRSVRSLATYGPRALDMRDDLRR